MTGSFAEQLAELAADVPGGPEMLADVLAEMTPMELAALAHDWAGFWRKQKQTPPAGPWRTWGDIGGRGSGKTIGKAQFVQEEVMAGRAMRIALIAQNEDQCIEVMVQGQSGLVAVSPPWFKARFEANRVIWPNGAQAFIYTPERPGELFGPEHHLGWASELHKWPHSKREEAFASLRMGLRLGYGRLIWDTNPVERHPLINELLADAEQDPDHNFVIRSTSVENKHNLTPGIVDEWIRKYGHTKRGRAMIYGEISNEAEGALWEQDWIDSHRRDLPEKTKRRILVVDPAISMRPGTDETGLCDLALGFDDQVYVIADLTKRLAWEAWGELVVKRYFAKKCDCVVLERNRGGDSCAANVRAAAAKISRETGQDIRVEIVKADAVTRHVAGVVFLKEVIGRSSKATRAEPVATHYEAGGVSHVNGAELESLEGLLTTWVPDEGGESPNALDALVYGVIELAGLGREKALKVDVVGTAKLQSMAAAQPKRAPVNVAAIPVRRGGGDRI